MDYSRAQDEDSPEGRDSIEGNYVTGMQGDETKGTTPGERLFEEVINSPESGSNKPGGTTPGEGLEPAPKPSEGEPSKPQQPPKEEGPRRTDS